MASKRRVHSAGHQGGNRGSDQAGGPGLNLAAKPADSVGIPPAKPLAQCGGPGLNLAAKPADSVGVPPAKPLAQCGNCPFWYSKKGTMGSCIRRAPVPLFGGQVTAHGPRGYFPATQDTEVCGEHPQFQANQLFSVVMIK